MTTRLLWLSLGGLLSACGGPPAPVTQGKPADNGVVAVVSNVPVATPVFTPLGPPGDMAPADDAPGPACKVAEHVLGPLADPEGNLFPVTVVADAKGGLAAWLEPGGVALQRIDTGGAPAGAPAHLAGTWPFVPTPHLAPEEVVLLAAASEELTLSRFERATLKPRGERRVARPPELKRILVTALDGDTLWLAGTRERDLALLAVGPEGAPRTAKIQLPSALPEDGMVTLGRKDGSVAVLITTISGKAWIAAETGLQNATQEDLAPSLGRFVRPLPIKLATGDTPYGLQTIPRYPLSRLEDAELLEQTPPEAFRTHGTFGFPATAWTGTHFLFAEVQGVWEEGKMDKLSAVISAVDCRGR